MPVRRLAGLSSITIAIALVSSVGLQPQGLDSIRARYTKQEFYVPMRDGVRLFTAVYAPKDRGQRYPIMLTRTPYSVAPYGADQYRPSLGPSPLFADDGFIFVYQDVRGRWMSEGTFDHMRPHKATKAGPKDIDESTDTYDTIEWLLGNIAGHNGRVGLWGISYPGFYAAAGIIDAHPALKASSPQAPVSDWFSSDDWHHNGAFLLAHAFGWFSSAGWPFTQPSTVRPGPLIDIPTADSYQFYLNQLEPVRYANERFFKSQIQFWNDMMTHDRKDEFWLSRNIRAHLRNIKPAVMTVGGWFDAENLFGALEVYRGIEAMSPGAENRLVMGPWVHGGWSRGTGDALGDVRFDSNTAEYFREEIELPFFDYYLKDNGAMELPEAYVFETGTNQWHQFDAWPPKGAQTRALYLHAAGRLSFEAPAADGDGDFDEYVSDPKKPVPITPGIAQGMAQRYMDDDQRYAARRPDVLVYQTDLLDGDVTVVGPVISSLQVSTTGTDQDFIVKLIDVYPDRFPDAKGDVNNTLGGYQQLVRGDVMRGKFRNSFEKPEPFAPGKPTKVEFTASDVFHTFRRGHRIMVQIQSTWFPLFDINPGRFVNIYQATEADFQQTTQRVYRSRALPSLVRVGVLAR
jgi:putative CocE/NonD family hydrolase